jgi:membrane-associated phospholipid phosphatase
MNNPVYDVDRAVASALQNPALQHNPVLHAIGATFNWWGGSGVVWFTAVIWLGARALKPGRVSLLGLRAAEAIAVASALNSLGKVFAGRARPFVTPGEPWHWQFLRTWTDARYFSMPSGHTASTIAFAAAISVASVRWARPARIAMILGAFSATLLVAFARMYTNQHWFSDVLTGAVLGATTGYLIARWHERHPGSVFDRVLAGAAAVEGA